MTLREWWRRYDNWQPTEQWWAKVAVGCFVVSALGFTVSLVAWIVIATTS